MNVIMDAKTAKAKANEIFLKNNEELILMYTTLINERILESVKKGQTYYGSPSSILFKANKFSEISDIVEAEFEKEGYRFRKGTYAKYFRWDDKEL
jgi:hypothetical protein